MWRQVQLRQIRADPVRGFKTLESTHGVGPNKKIRHIGDIRLMDDSEVVKSGTTQYQVRASPFLFLCVPEVMLRTLTTSGKYWVDER